ncbi:MAG: hypothetical protein WC561_06865, partial [Candidatus Omnitrophota bacterium]
MKESIRISKLDAAKRQLETAVRIYFSNGDPVSIHTLVSASYNIIKDINKKREGKPMLVKEVMIEFVKPEYQKMIKGIFNEAENFFKHANLDSEKSLDFNPELSELLMLDAISHYYGLTGEDSPLFQIFRAWYIINNPLMFNLPEETKRMMGSFDSESIKAL